MPSQRLWQRQRPSGTGTVSDTATEFPQSRPSGPPPGVPASLGQRGVVPFVALFGW